MISARRVLLLSVLPLVSETCRHNSRTKSTSSHRSGSRENWKASRPVSCFPPPACPADKETTILTLMAPLLHLGMILVGVPYSTQELYTTQGGGSPYGPGHVAGDDNKRQIDEQEAAICRALGRRLAVIGL